MRWAKLNRKEPTYKPIISFDIETANENKEFILAVFYFEGGSKTFYTKEDCQTFLDSRFCRKHHLFATNTAFDFLGLFMDIPDKWQVLERNGAIYGFTYYQSYNPQAEQPLKNPIKCYDTLRLIPASVEQLGKLIGIPKSEKPSFLGERPQTREQWQELQAYCERDAEVTYKTVTEILYPYLQKWKIPLKYTTASLALSLIENHFLDGKSFFQEDERTQEFVRQSYYGGLTMNFKRGLFDKSISYDVNSLYPTVMCKPLPDPNSYKYYETGTLYNISKYMGVSHVKVTAPKNMYIPILPYKQNGKLILPTGTFSGVWTHAHLEYALNHGYIIHEVYEQVIYRKTTTFLKSFIETLYRERQEYQKIGSPLEKMSKLMMNSAYGKFAFNHKNCNQIIHARQFKPEIHMKDGNLPIPLWNNTFFAVTYDMEKPPRYVFSIFSSYITSYAQLHMQEYLQNPFIQKHVHYIDTDSLHLNVRTDKLPLSSTLGDFKEETISENVLYIKPKMYETQEKFKCKGLKLNKKKEIQDILQGKKIEQIRFVKFRTALRSQEHHKFGKLVPNQLLTIEKTVSLEDDKRVWKSTFSPFEIQDSTAPSVSLTQTITNEQKSNS